MKTFFFFGDSLTLGVNDPQCKGWVGRLGEKAIQAGVPVPPTTWYNLGARKHSSAAILQRWKSEFEARALPEGENYLVFSFGTVDMATPAGDVVIPLEQSVANARAILTEAKAIAPVMLVSPPPVAGEEHTQRLDILSTAYTSLCEDIAVPYHNIFQRIRCSGYMNDLADGIHPGAEGSEIFADLLMTSETLKDWLTK